MSNNSTPLAIIRPIALYAILKPIKYIALAAIATLATYFLKPYVPLTILKYAVGGLVALLFIIHILQYLFIHSIKYTITKEQILFKRGIFTIKTDYIELYRIIDFTTTRSFLLRFIGGMTFAMDTMDKSHPVFKLEGIPRSNVDEIIRSLVEDNRRQKRVFISE